MKIFLPFIALLYSLGLSAQQRGHFTQYMVNQFIMNPALAGTEEYADFKAGYRKQWAGFQGSPSTVYVSGHMSIGRPRINPTGVNVGERNNWHGVGLMMYNDIAGATNRLGAYLAYAYNIGITEKLRASVGAFGGFQQFKIDGNKFNLFHDTDDVLNGVHRKTVPDVVLGTWVYSDKFYAGISAHQLIRNKISFGDNKVIIQNPSELVIHYFFTSGYTFILKDFAFTPSLMVKYVSPTPASFDVNFKVAYKDGLVWSGVSYRNMSSLSVMFGIALFNGVMPLSYSHDFTNSILMNHQSGTHEIVLGYKIHPRPIVDSPAGFW